MELVFVRHALPVRIDAAEGPADPGLAALGQQQAVRLASALIDEHVDVIVTSPQRRAVETAAPLAERLGLAVEVVEGVAEFDPSATSYVPVEELKAAGDPRWHLLAAGQLYSPDVDPGAFRTRVVDAVESVVAAHPGRRVVLFSHAGAINAYTAHVLGFDQPPIWFVPAYTSITRVAASRTGRRGIVSLNETGHVRDLLH
ncbi:MAG: histidine phosphatase family protein [Actinomycetota bacterium]|nr:histidine phosphatase family protein [Actinomycetota bacterium]